MNIRSLTRSDGAVIVGAVLLFIASFLNPISVDCPDTPPGVPNTCKQTSDHDAWETGLFPYLPAVFLLGVIAGVLIVVSRFTAPGLKIAGQTLDQWGTGFAVATLFSALFLLFGGPGRGDGSDTDMGMGIIFGVLGALILAAGAVLTHLVPALAAPLLGAGGPRPQPYGGQQPGGYGYQGGQQPGGYGYPGGGQPQQPYGQQPQPGAAQPAKSLDPNFQPFWFAVPVARPLYGEDGSPTPVAELTPGNWYLAVEQRGQALVAQTQDGRRGVLQDTTGIQRG